MIIANCENVHVVMRRSFHNQVRRHFVEKIDAADGAVIRATGFVFIYDAAKAQYTRKAQVRATILDLSESGYIVNVLPPNVDLAELRYETVDRSYMAVVDGHGFTLDVNDVRPEALRRSIRDLPVTQRSTKSA